MSIQEKKRVLLVEDDIELATLIQEYLQTMEFEVDIEPDGSQAEARVFSLNPDLVILDLMLPGKDGISICKAIREQFKGGIIMLTASGESIDHVLGLELGADDYLTKPVEPRILLAHSRAVLRRLSEVEAISKTASAKNDHYKSGNLSIQFDSRKVTLATNELDLTGPEYDLLCILVKKRGNILSRDALLNELKGIEYDGQNRFIDITVSQLRSKLSSDGVSHKHIKTVRSKGYLFAEDV